MTKPKPKALGTSVEVAEGATILRPDNTTVTSSGGLYVFDLPGDHIIDGQAITAGEPDAEADAT